MTTPSPARLIAELTELQTRLTKGLDTTLSVHGINYTEYNVLRFLNDSPNRQLRRVDLAERLGITASGVTRLLNPMEKTGLVKKLASERDARVSLVALTKGGERIYSETEVTVHHFAERFLRNLKADQRRLLVDLLDQLR